MTCTKSVRKFPKQQLVTNSVSKVTKRYYCLLPSLRILKEEELPNCANIVCPSGDIPTSFGEGFCSENLKHEEGNRKRIKKHKE